jgi:hypothetical protein
MRKVSAARAGQFWAAQMETLNATARVGRELTRETALSRVHIQHNYEVPGPAEHSVIEHRRRSPNVRLDMPN